MASIATNIDNDQTAPAEERLLKLFRNRAELKQEFAKLRREGDQLKERLQKQEGKLLRVQQRLDQLEGMLADPTQAVNAAVFYQLRGIWVNNGKLLSRLAKELAANQIKREQARSIESFEDSRNALAAELQKQALHAQDKLQEIERKLNEATAEYEKRLGFWRFRKRRQLRATINGLVAKREVADTQFKRRKHNWEKKAAEKAPVIDSLSVEGKRKINLALIAVAQEILLHFTKSNIAELAREASVRKVVDVNYGGLEKCRELNNFIDGRVQCMPMGDDLLAKVKTRAKYLQTHANYRHTADAIPVAGSFAIIPKEISTEGAPVDNKSIATNVLAEEFWEIYSVLLS